MWWSCNSCRFHREPVLRWTADQGRGFCQDAKLAQLQLPSRHQLLLAHLRGTQQRKRTNLSLRFFYSSSFNQLKLNHDDLTSTSS